MASLLTVRLSKGDSPSWGFRLQGGKDFATPLVIQKVIVGSPAERAGLVAGDSVIRVNNTDVFNLRHKDAQDVLLRAGFAFDMTIQRGGSTWKPSVIPTGNISSPSLAVNNISPVTRTSLAAKPSENIGAIGTGHNVSARPFLNGTVNGGPKLVNSQYNSPLKLYSEESIAETLSAQTEVLSTGALGVNFKKNEKNYDASKSAVLSLLKEEESSPRSTEYSDQHHASSGIDTASSPVSVAGLRHVTAPENKPQPPSPQLPPGQNICADCERLIVGVFVRIKDKNLHVECFKCSTCGSSLKNVGYYNINNKLYCDVHAKLAARSNPPAPNLVPITVPPGGKAPANTISAALASQPYPISAPLSPKIGSYQSPLTGPKPFGGVSGPLSPNYNSLPRIGAPLSPVAPILTPSHSPIATTVHSISNVVWPPVQEEPELPSACPLFYPPPSQINIKPRNRQISESSDCSELEKINIMDQDSYHTINEMSFSSGRRSATECVETISELVERQKLVETIVKSRPQSPPQPEIQITPRTKLEKEKSVQSECKKCTKSDEVPHITLETERWSTSNLQNVTPKKWESQMLQALKMSVDDSVGSTPSDMSYPKTSDFKECSSGISNPSKEDTALDTFSNIPTKKTSTALGSALSVAPVEPFNPTKLSIIEPVPLPEETIPYFPPDDLFVISPKEQDTEKPKSGKKKKDPNLEKLLDDLPKPQGRISMLAALTTAPDRPFTPESFQRITSEESVTETSTESLETRTTKTIEKREVPKIVHPNTLPESLKIQEEPNKQLSPECLPLFQGFTCSFQNKTDRSQFDIQISTVSPKSQKGVAKKDGNSIANSGEFIETQTREETTESSVCTKKRETKSTETIISENKTENIVFKKPEQMISLRKPEALPQYQINVKDDAEANIIMMEKMDRAKQKKEAEKHSNEVLQKKKSEETCLTKTERKNDINQSQKLSSAVGPVIKVQESELYSSENSFKPVLGSRPPSCTFSPKPRPLTPSMVNKPPSILPYYQANLVAQKYGPLPVNLLDPKSPGISRPSSPMPDSSRLLGSKSSNIRPKSPAQGPPGNPIERSHIPTSEDFKLEEAKESLNRFIPQYKEKIHIKEENETYRQNDSKNDHRNLMCTSDVITKKEAIPDISIEGETKFDVVSTSFGNNQTRCKIEESRLRQTADSQREETRSHISGSTELTTKVSEKSHLQKSDDFRKMENKSVERSADGSVQKQIKKTVIEEMEHTQKLQEIVIEKNKSTSKNHAFRNVRNPEEVDHHVIGLHVTAPNPIQSPFLKCIQDSVPPKLNTVCQKIGKDVPCTILQEDPETPKEKIPIVPKFDASKLPQPKTVPELTETTTEEKKVPPKPIKHIDAPGSSTVNQKLNPNVHPSDIGAGGGRQTGAIGVAPKRGRGVLSSGQLGGRIPLCGQCHGQIRGPFITALGKIWCPNHFICATPSCRRPLQDMGFVEEQGQLYCEYCFEQYLAPICAKCGSKIKGDCLKAIGKGFHPECFNCVHCGKLFGNSPFFIEDGSPYCDTDWNELFTTKCFACGFPVEAGDRWVEALNNNYHSQCFNCTMCKKNLEGQSFFAKGGRPYCKNHAR